MIGHTRFIAAVCAATVVLAGCSDRQSSSPTGPAIPAAASRNQSGGESSHGSSSRSGPLHVTKDCTTYTGLAGGFCVITSSNVKEIEVGTRVVYAKAAGPTSVDTDFILDPPGSGHGTASGHVVLDRVNATGVATISGGTGKFSGFSATILIKLIAGRSWAWEGTYSFDGKGQHCDEN